MISAPYYLALMFTLILCKLSSQTIDLGEGSLVELIKINKLLLRVEDSLWALIQNDKSKGILRQLWPKNVCRFHTAYGRLSSLVSWSQSKEGSLDQKSLANNGLINISDDLYDLRFYEKTQILIDNVFQSKYQSL